MLSKVRFTAVNTLRKQMMAAQTTRGFLDHLGLDSQGLALREERGQQARAVDLWKASTEKKDGLVLKTDDEIENYVISIVRDYFRTTKKASVKLDSLFADHGLDSLDAIELVIRVEDDLGYMIEAENLEKFKKPRHFVNFIRQMEAYKEEFNSLPRGGEKYKFNVNEAFPGLPKIGH